MIDGVGFYTYNPAIKDSDTWPFDSDQYLILNIAMGGFAGTIDPSFTQSDMVIDYVRVYQNNPLSIDEDNSFGLKVHPNPASKNFNIQTSKPIERIDLYNSLGQIVKRLEGNVSVIDIENLNSGIYILKISADGQIATERVIID
jgi:hypothetical protein